MVEARPTLSIKNIICTHNLKFSSGHTEKNKNIQVILIYIMLYLVLYYKYYHFNK